MSRTTCHANIRRRYDGTHYNKNAQHRARDNSTKCITLPLPCKSQHTHLPTVYVHNNRPIDSAHFAQPMSDNSTSPYCSPSLVHLCNNSPASSTCIVSYIGGPYSRTVPNVDIVGSSRCHTRHLTTGGVARFYFYFVLAPNSNPVMTLPTTWTVVLEYLVQVVASWGHSLYGKRKRKRRRFWRRSFRHLRPYTKTGLTKTKTLIVFCRRVQAAQVWFVLRIPAQARVSK